LEADLKTCTFGFQHASPIVLFGDSHAAQWFPAIESISAKRDLPVVTILKFGCPMEDVPFYEPIVGRILTECDAWRKKAISKIREIQPILTVVTSSERYLVNDEEWQAGVNKTVKNLAESSGSVLILRDTPAANFEIPTCLAERVWRPSVIPAKSCEFSFPEQSEIYEFQRLAAAQFDNVLTADMSLAICPHRICTGQHDNLITYRDTNHLTASFVKTLAEALGLEVDKALQQNHQLHSGPVPLSSSIPHS
jgi:hypothetical protein